MEGGAAVGMALGKVLNNNYENLYIFLYIDLQCFVCFLWRCILSFLKLVSFLV